MQKFPMVAARRRKKRRGAAMVEMAVCFPIFMLMLLGIIEFGRALMVSQLLTSAAREGCREAMVDGTTKGTVETEIKNRVVATVGCPAADIEVTTTVTALATGVEIANLEDAERRDLVQVNVSVPYNSVSYGVGRFLPGQDLRATCTMRKE